MSQVVKAVVTIWTTWILFPLRFLPVLAGIMKGVSAVETVPQMPEVQFLET